MLSRLNTSKITSTKTCFSRRAPEQKKPKPAKFRQGFALIATLNPQPPVIVSQGDAAGAGWFAFKEIIAGYAKLLGQQAQGRYNARRLVVVGDTFENDKAFLQKYFHVLTYTAKVETVEEVLADKKVKKPLFLSVASGKAVEPGKGNSLVALRSWHAFQKALKLFQTHSASAFVTLPVSKELIMKAGVDFNGHTGELASAFGQRVFMCMYHKKFSVIPLTEHIPLALVPRKLYEVNVSDLATALVQFRAIFKPVRKMAWCGVNPHCGENGRIGNEEEFVVRSIETLAKHGVVVEGPVSADAVFTKHVLSQYSLVLANYHDQGLIPYKALAGMAGVNTTLGLPRLRVSPDHGTAFTQTAAKQVDISGVLASLRFAFDHALTWQQASQLH